MRRGLLCAAIAAAFASAACGAPRAPSNATTGPALGTSTAAAFSTATTIAADTGTGLAATSTATPRGGVLTRPLHPLSVRTGLPEVDWFLQALEAQDWSAIASGLKFATVSCADPGASDIHFRAHYHLQCEGTVTVSAPPPFFILLWSCGGSLLFEDRAEASRMLREALAGRGQRVDYISVRQPQPGELYQGRFEIRLRPAASALPSPTVLLDAGGHIVWAAAGGCPTISPDPPANAAFLLPPL